MNAERLLQRFDRISEAPNAIPRLRRFILDLAVRGKLVEQDPNDEPASELLKLVPKGSVTPAVPPGWISGAFGNLLEMQYGKGLPAKDRKEQGEVPVFGSNGVVGYTDAALTDKPAITIGRKGSAGALNLCDGPSWTTDVAYFLVPPNYFNIRFLLFTLATLDLAALGKGVKPGLSRSDTYQLPLAIPPLTEQHRIIVKVDELMALCDQLEAAKIERERSRDRLVMASLYRLNSLADTAETDAPDLPARQADAFRDHARFVLHHLARLTTSLEHIKQLRQTILNLAVRGKLVPQDPNDESVDALLTRVAAERQGLIAKGRLKAQKSCTDVDAEPPSQPIPATWRWRRLADLISFGPQNGISPKPTNNTESPKALTLTATTSGAFDASHYKHVDLREVDCQNYWLSAGDVLFQRGNTREYVGIAAVFDGPEKSFVFPDLMIRVRFAEALSLRFIHMTLISPLLRRYFSVEATGASASMPKISQGVLLNAPIPLPPLAEQHRIIARVDELMALCDQLEAQLTTTEADSHRLLEAVLHEALNPALAAAEQMRLEANA